MSGQLPRVRRQFPVVDEHRQPTLQFQIDWDLAMRTIEQQAEQIEALQEAVASLDVRVTALEP